MSAGRKAAPSTTNAAFQFGWYDALLNNGVTMAPLTCHQLHSFERDPLSSIPVRYLFFALSPSRIVPKLDTVIVDVPRRIDAARRN